MTQVNDEQGNGFAKQRDRLRNIVGGVIVAAWSISFLADLVVKDYNAPASVHALMLVLAGYLFGGSTVSTLKRTLNNNA